MDSLDGSVVPPSAPELCPGKPHMLPLTSSPVPGGSVNSCAGGQGQLRTALMVAPAMVGAGAWEEMLVPFTVLLGAVHHSVSLPLRSPLSVLINWLHLQGDVSLRARGLGWHLALVKVLMPFLSWASI